MRDTSLKTYEQIIEEGLVGQNQLVVLEALNKIKVPATDREIAKFLGLDDPNSVRPRRKELLDMGIIIDFGKRKCSVTGRESYIWGIANEIRFKKIERRANGSNRSSNKSSK